MPGRWEVAHLPIGTLATGAPLSLAVHILNSGQEGPCLGLVATLHGNETIGAEVVVRVLQGLRSENWRGSVIAFPLANPLAFESLSRNTPLDMLNLNRLFPGSRQGWLSEQIASAIWDRVSATADAIVDLHGADAFTANDYIFLPLPLSDAHQRARLLALAFGQEWLYEAPDMPGSLTACALAAGIPAIVPELGTDMWQATDFVAKGVRGVRNVMRRLKMLPGTLELPQTMRVVRTRVTLRTQHGGLFLPTQGMEVLGTVIAGGTTLATVVQADGLQELEVLKAPYGETIVLLARGRSRINPGDYAYICGDAATAEAIAP